MTDSPARDAAEAHYATDNSAAAAYEIDIDLTLHRLEGGEAVQTIKIAKSSEDVILISSRGRLPRRLLRNYSWVRKTPMAYKRLVVYDVVIEHDGYRIAEFLGRSSDRPRLLIRWLALIRFVFAR